MWPGAKIGWEIPNENNASSITTNANTWKSGATKLFIFFSGPQIWPGLVINHLIYNQVYSRAINHLQMVQTGYCQSDDCDGLSDTEFGKFATLAEKKFNTD